MLSALRNSRAVQAVLGQAKSSAEAEPLLSPPEDRKPKRTPLPAKQLFILCLMRTAEPVAFTIIYPFIAQMIEHLGITDDPAKVGYYAGVVESAFAFSTFLSVVAWGRISDRIGRKPVLLIGLGGVTLSLLAFGTSKSLLGMVIARCVGGGLNGNVAVLKSMVGELSDETNQGIAFTFLPLSWSLGSIIGPIIGGYTSEPARRYGGVFDNALFREYPFLLPCLVGATAPFLTGLVGGYYLEETLKKPQPALAPADAPSSATSDSGTVVDLEATLTPAAPPLSALFTRDVLAVLVVYMLLALQSVALDAVFVLFCFTPRHRGGLAFDEADIGRALSLGGVATVFFQVLVYPRAQARWGTIRLYRATLGLYVPTFLLLIWCGFVAGRAGEGESRGVWAVMGVYLVVKSVANTSYASNMLAVTSVAPSKALLGTLNGISQMGSSLMRTIGPFSASSLFAYSLETRGSPTVLILGLAGMAAGTTAVSFEMNTEVVGWRKAVVEEEGEEEQTGRERSGREE